MPSKAAEWLRVLVSRLQGVGVGVFEVGFIYIYIILYNSGLGAWGSKGI